MLPLDLAPMLPTASQQLPEPERDWVYEVKFDGFRALAFCTGEQLRLVSRNKREMSFFYPELHPLGKLLPQTILDGELVAFNEHGQPDFERMQARAGFYPELGPRRLASIPFPICYQVFDLLYHEGRSLLRLPYHQRRERLESLPLQGESWMVPSVSPGENGAQLLAASRAQGLEGLVAKRLDSLYQPGQRSPSWLKIKNWKRQEFVIAAYRRDPAGIEGWLGKLLVGYYEGDRLRYAGGVEVGFNPITMEALRELLPRLTIEDWPFGDERPRKPDEFALDPCLIAEVQFLDWSSGGLIRHCAFKGFVLDRDPRAVCRE